MNIWFICLRTRVPCVYGKDISLLNCECLNSPPDLNVLRWLLSYCYDMALFIVWFRKKNWNFKLLKKNSKKNRSTTRFVCLDKACHRTNYEIDMILNRLIRLFVRLIFDMSLTNWSDSFEIMANSIWNSLGNTNMWNYRRIKLNWTEDYFTAKFEKNVRVEVSKRFEQRVFLIVLKIYFLIEKKTVFRLVQLEKNYFEQKSK